MYRHRCNILKLQVWKPAKLRNLSGISSFCRNGLETPEVFRVTMHPKARSPRHKNFAELLAGKLLGYFAMAGYRFGYSAGVVTGESGMVAAEPIRGTLIPNVPAKACRR